MDVDLVIVTPLKGVEEIVRNLRCRGIEKVLTIGELLDMLEQG